MKSDFGQQQRRGLPRYSVEVLETGPNVHSNIIGPCPRDLAKRLTRSRVYGENIVVKRVTDMPGLVGYLLKEATPQAAYGKSFRRNKGSHRLGEGGGDRVRLSNELASVLIEEGVVERYRRTYAALRAIPKPDSAPTASAAVPNDVPEPVPQTVPIDVPALHSVQLALPLEAPPMKVIELVETKRRRLGIPQHAVAARLGVRQPHYANTLRRHDNLSAWSMNRALEFLAA